MKALYVVESQPPNLAELIGLFSIIDKYEHVVICVSNVPKVMPLCSVFTLWEMMVKPYKDKITLSYTKDNFMSLSKLGEEYKDFKVVTISPELYTHLHSLNANVELLPRVIGYEPIFMRAAYRQARALDWLRTHMVEANSV